MNRIEEIKERLNKSTSGTWEVFEDRDAKTKGLSKKGIHTEGFTIAFFPDYDFDDDIHFIANAQSDVQYLLSKLEVAEKELDDLRFKTQVIASHCALQKDRYENVQAAYAFEKTQAIYEGIDTVIKQLRE